MSSDFLFQQKLLHYMNNIQCVRNIEKYEFLGCVLIIFDIWVNSGL